MVCYYSMSIPTGCWATWRVCTRLSDDVESIYYAIGNLNLQQSQKRRSSFGRHHSDAEDDALRLQPWPMASPSCLDLRSLIFLVAISRKSGFGDNRGSARWLGVRRQLSHCGMQTGSDFLLLRPCLQSKPLRTATDPRRHQWIEVRTENKNIYKFRSVLIRRT